MPLPLPIENWVRNPSDELAIAQGCRFDEQIAGKVCAFVETFCHQSKGRWAGKPLSLMEWQRDFLSRLFGWLAPDGRRRFKSFYLEVGKKNGKSTLITTIAIYLALIDAIVSNVPDGAPEIYLNAVDREQASIVFDEAVRMVKASPDLSSRLEIVQSKGRIIDPAGYGKIQRNSADAPSKDGVNATGSLFDELHRFKSRELWDVFKYAGASREQPIRGVITTAGEEEAGPWYEQRVRSEQINSGAVLDVSHLGVVFRADPADDFDNPATWRKANPSLGITIKEEEFRADLVEAKRTPTEWANFLRLRLNIVARGEQQFVSVEDWNSCAASHTGCPGDPAYGGLDLSQTQDLSAFLLIVGDADSGFDVLSRFWLPEDGIVELERAHQVPYRAWADAGFIELTPGNVIDYAFIRAEIVALANQWGVRRIFADPYNATKLGIELKEQDGLPIEFLRQGYLSLSAPTKELLRLVLGQKLRHAGHPILRWHAANAVAEQDAAANLKLSKRKSKKKIDGMAALVNAIAAATSDNDAGPSVYESPGRLYL
jgi:phage terminase large subunit-like protein